MDTLSRWIMGAVMVLLAYLCLLGAANAMDAAAGNTLMAMFGFTVLFGFRLIALGEDH